MCCKDNAQNVKTRWGLQNLEPLWYVLMALTTPNMKSLLTNMSESTV